MATDMRMQKESCEEDDILIERESREDTAVKGITSWCVQRAQDVQDMGGAHDGHVRQEQHKLKPKR